MLKFLCCCCALLLSSLHGQAQVASQPFIKISHLGTQGRPIVDLFMATQEPALNAELGMDGRYRFQSVCLLTEAEFIALLRYAESYTAKAKSDGKDEKYGTFEITLGPSPAAKRFIYTRTKSLAFLNGATQVLQKQAAGPDKSEALNRLELTIRRLNASK